jgi:hypothetical protein
MLCRDYGDQRLGLDELVANENIIQITEKTWITVKPRLYSNI